MKWVQAPTSTPTTAGKIVLSTTVTGVDYIKLNQNVGVKAAFVSKIQEAIAAQAGVGASDVVVALSPGGQAASLVVTHGEKRQLEQKTAGVVVKGLLTHALHCEYVLMYFTCSFT